MKLRTNVKVVVLVALLASSARASICHADEDLAALLSEPVESTAGKSVGNTGINLIKKGRLWVLKSLQMRWPIYSGYFFASPTRPR